MNELLSRSAELEAILVEFLVVKPIFDTERTNCSRIVCSIAFEHAESAKMLIATGNFTSATGLVRLQYEALVRPMWLLFAASDLAVSKLMCELTTESADKANKLPMVSEMLDILDGKAPKEALDMLLEFKEYSWKPLNSFIHGGIHAKNRHSKEYPSFLLFQLLKASNGLSMMLGMLLVIISGDSRYRGKIPEIQKEYSDYLPDYKHGNA